MNVVGKGHSNPISFEFDRYISLKNVVVGLGY